MRFLKQFLAAASLAFIAGAAAAAPGNPQPGVDFKMVATPQPTESGKKIEVIEFFGYFCPHCYALDPALAEWVKKQGDRIDFKRVHVQFDPRMAPIQQAYIALEVMGKTEAVHKKIFDAMHIQRARLNTVDEIADFLGKNGIDKAKFLEAYNSFGVAPRMTRAGKLASAYGVDHVPMLIVDGRFQTEVDMMRNTLGRNAPEASLHPALMQTLDGLVERAIKEKGGAAGAPATKKK